MDESKSYNNMTSTVSEIIRSKYATNNIPEITKQKLGKVELHFPLNNKLSSTVLLRPSLKLLYRLKIEQEVKLIKVNVITVKLN